MEIFIFIFIIIVILLLTSKGNTEKYNNSDDSISYKTEPCHNIKDTTMVDELNLQKHQKESEEFRKLKALYDEHMQSAKWRRIRLKRLQFDDMRCLKCGSGINLICHHISYKNIGNEHQEDLRTLCYSCHNDLHEDLGYPQTLACYKTKIFWKSE